MNFDSHDRTVLRELAKQVAEIAARPEIARRRKLWVEHNSLRSTIPMLLVFPEGAWEELLPARALACREDRAREIEWQLRSRLYTFEHFQDDTVVEAEWVVGAPVRDSGWGLEPAKIPSPERRGAFRIEPVLREHADFKKMHLPDLIYDREAHEAKLEQAHGLFGGILEVKRAGIKHISYHLWSQYIHLRGETQFLVDMLDAPDFIHEVMSFFEAGHHRLLRQMIDLNLLSLNNDNTYHSSGGNGFTDVLPKPGFDPQHIRPCDMWASAESQELAPVSPRMHREFALRYENRLLEPFGLTGYGCCEDLSRKLEDVLAIPHIRRISISPFADVDACARKLGGKAIFSWKPQPSHLVGDFDPAAIREYIRHTLSVARMSGCVLEMILKDTHTCEHHPERFDVWTRIARELILEEAEAKS
jgi:hypothetical protein